MSENTLWATFWIVSAAVILGIVAAFWSGHSNATSSHERVAKECIASGGSAVVIGGERHCLKLSPAK